MKKITGIENVLRYMIKKDITCIDDDTPQLYFDYNEEHEEYFLRNRKKSDNYGMGIDMLYHSGTVTYDFDIFRECVGEYLGDNVAGILSRFDIKLQFEFIKAMIKDAAEHEFNFIIDEDLVCVYKIYEM